MPNIQQTMVLNLLPGIEQWSKEHLLYSKVPGHVSEWKIWSVVKQQDYVSNFFSYHNKVPHGQNQEPRDNILRRDRWEQVRIFWSLVYNTTDIPLQSPTIYATDWRSARPSISFGDEHSQRQLPCILFIQPFFRDRLSVKNIKKIFELLFKKNNHEPGSYRFFDVTAITSCQ